MVEHVPEGTRYDQEAGGGSGYGFPVLRPARKMLEEVKDGLINIEKAFNDYRVVIDPITLTLGKEETQKSDLENSRRPQ